MVETQYPKFNWGIISEKNSGHTKNEWGTQEKPTRVIAYKMVWDKET